MGDAAIQEKVQVTPSVDIGTAHEQPFRHSKSYIASSMILLLGLIQFEILTCRRSIKTDRMRISLSESITETPETIKNYNKLVKNLP